MIIRSGVRQVLGGAGAIEYMILDEFDDTDPAPLTDPRTLPAGYVTITGAARMGTGSGVLTATEASAFAGVAYSKNNGSPTTLADGMLFGFSRQQFSGTSGAGTGLRADTAQTGNYVSFGLSCNYSSTLYKGGAFYNFASNVFAPHVTVAFWLDGGLTYVYNYDTSFPSPRWRLLLIVPSLSGNYYASMQTCINQVSGTNIFKAVKVREGLTGLIDSVAMGTSAGSTADAASSDFMARFVVATRPSADSILFNFRIQDASNYWQVAINSAGDLTLNEIVAGVSTPRQSSAGVVAASGERIVISANDSVIDVWADATRIRYATATNFKTETACELSSLGTGGAVSGVALHRLYPSETVLNTVKKD